MCLLSGQCGWAFLASLCTDGGCDCAHWDASAGGVALRASSHTCLAPRCFFTCPLSMWHLILQDPSCACSSGRYSRFLFFGFQEHRSSGWQALWLRWGAVPVPFPPHLLIRASHRASPDGCARGPCRGTNTGRWGSLGFLSKDERCVLGAFSCSLHAIFVL